MSNRVKACQSETLEACLTGLAMQDDVDIPSLVVKIERGILEAALAPLSCSFRAAFRRLLYKATISLILT